MSEFVGELLEFISIEVGGVVDNVVVYRGDGTLPNLLRDQQEIVHVSPGDFRVDDGAREGVVFLALLVGAEKSLVDSLLQHHVRQFRLPTLSRLLTGLFDEIIHLKKHIITDNLSEVSFRGFNSH